MILLTVTLLWLALGGLAWGALTWRLRHSQKSDPDRLNSLAMAGGMLLVFYAAYGAVALVLAWLVYGLWWTLA
jgi:hypothetical protein